jgi:hypothetical protein
MVEERDLSGLLKLAHEELDRAIEERLAKQRAEEG